MTCSARPTSNIALPEALAGIAARLRDAVPLSQLLVIDLDRQRQALGVVPAQTRRDIDGAPPSPGAFRRILGWVEEGEIVAVGELREDSPGIARAIPPAAHGARGLLVVEPVDGGACRTEPRRLMTALLEPPSVALDNYHRLSELEGLRASAEADRQSLLARLGRDMLSDTAIDANEGLRGVFERVGKVCASDLPVLILGENRSGKEVVAHQIHTRSPHVDAPFIRVTAARCPPRWSIPNRSATTRKVSPARPTSVSTGPNVRIWARFSSTK